MGQYTSTLNPTTTTSSLTPRNLAHENKLLRDIINDIRKKWKEYMDEVKIRDDEYKKGLAEISEMMANPQPPEDPIEAEFERPILKNTQNLKDELQKFAEFITGNMDAILASPEIISDGGDASDEILFMQLVNSAGFEYARAEVAKKNFANNN